MPCQNPLALPDSLDQRLQPVVSLWEHLKRAENRMPFTDDLNLSILSNLSGNSFLLSAFTSPERFRFEFLNEVLQRATPTGTFVDETSSDLHFSYLQGQSSITVEAAEPTLLRLTHASGQKFSRILLPMWGNGQVNMLLGMWTAMAN